MRGGADDNEPVVAGALSLERQVVQRPCGRLLRHREVVVAGVANSRQVGLRRRCTRTSFFSQTEILVTDRKLEILMTTNILGTARDF